MAAADVLFVTQYFRPELIGSGPFCADIADWLARRGARIQVLTSRPHYPERAVFAGYERGQRDREQQGNLRIARVPTVTPRGGGAKQRVKAELNFLARGLAAHWRGRAPAAPLVLALCPSVLSVLLGAMVRPRGGRLAAIVHDIQSGLAEGLGMVKAGGLGGAIRNVETRILNQADIVVVLSADMRDRLRSQGVTARIVIAPIWVDTDQIRPLPRDPDRPLTVLYSGNLGRKQGLDQVLDMAALLGAARPQVQVVVRGNGSRRDELQAAAAQRGLANLCFEDLWPRERFAEGLAQGDIHLVPQDPLAADFAVPSKAPAIMAAGRPMVATAHTDSTLARLAAESGAALIAPPNDAAAFAACVQQLVDDAALRARMGAAGRAYATAEFARDAVLERLFAAITGEAHQAWPLETAVTS